MHSINILKPQEKSHSKFLPLKSTKLSTFNKKRECSTGQKLKIQGRLRGYPFHSKLQLPRFHAFWFFCSSKNTSQKPQRRSIDCVFFRMKLFLRTPPQPQFLEHLLCAQHATTGFTYQMLRKVGSIICILTMRKLRFTKRHSATEWQL